MLAPLPEDVVHAATALAPLASADDDQGWLRLAAPGISCEPPRPLFGYLQRISAPVSGSIATVCDATGGVGRAPPAARRPARVRRRRLRAGPAAG